VRLTDTEEGALCCYLSYWCTIGEIDLTIVSGCLKTRKCQCVKNVARNNSVAEIVDRQNGANNMKVVLITRRS
jgi:hypothetical protein